MFLVMLFLGCLMLSFFKKRENFFLFFVILIILKGVLIMGVCIFVRFLVSFKGVCFLKCMIMLFMRFF